MSFQELFLKVEKLTALLLAMHLPLQSKIAILSENRPEWVIADLAIQAAGHVVVPIYPTLSAEQLEYILKHSESVLVLVSTRKQLRKAVKASRHLANQIWIMDHIELHHASPEGQSIGDSVHNLETLLQRTSQPAADFFKKHAISRAIVKPATGGSSIGVFSVGTVSEALERAEYIFSKRMDTRVVIEPFATGKEFTVILLENRFGQGVAVLPTEIEADYSEHQIFDFRKKYLPTRQVTYHCPPRFSNEVIEKIQIEAEQLFSVLGMRDFARFDGWVMPDGNIWFSDFNPISGMEQNSFLFQQSARLGFSHRDTLRFIVKNACRRYKIPFVEPKRIPAKRKPVRCFLGELPPNVKFRS
jgi:acyl-CoA synthetase (AMP-forming)/AMP-acid ligase II